MSTPTPTTSAGLSLDGSMAQTGLWRSKAGTNLAMAGLLWCWLFGELWFEWSVSEQYGYGLFVPFLGAYLLWLRVEDCPAPQPSGRTHALPGFLACAALAQYPLAILYGANADWRPLAWGEALLAFGGSIWLLAHWGGRPWVRHFTPALALFLFAVPWPSKWQSLLVNTLMNLVAAATVEALNWFGHPAVQHEHIIQLSQNVYVGVEEACSGVRSVQSTLMAGWLVGELWRYRPWGRVVLMFWAAGVAILFNLGRTLSLSLLAASRGAEVMEEYHDAAGYLVFGLSFATVLAGAWYARPRQKKPALSEKNSSAGGVPPA
jgi:exosortase